MQLPAEWVRGNSVCMAQAVLDILGGSFDGIVDANLLPWAQLAWGAGGTQANTAVAASLVQRLDWQEMAFALPGSLPPVCITPHTFLLYQQNFSCLYLTDHKLGKRHDCRRMTTMRLPALDCLNVAAHMS